MKLITIFPQLLGEVSWEYAIYFEGTLLNTPQVMFTVKPEIYARQIESLSFPNLLLASGRQPGCKNSFPLPSDKYFISSSLHPSIIPTKNIATIYYSVRQTLC